MFLNTLTLSANFTLLYGYESPPPLLAENKAIQLLLFFISTQYKYFVETLC